MSTTTIREIVTGRSIHSIAPETTLEQAAALMARRQVGALAVLEGDELVGILSERDIVYRAVAKGLAMDSVASTVMTRDPARININDAVSEALVVKLGEAFRHLPVMEEGRVVALISFRDIPAEYAMLYERFREMSSSRADER